MPNWKRVLLGGQRRCLSHSLFPAYVVQPVLKTYDLKYKSKKKWFVLYDGYLW